MKDISNVEPLQLKSLAPDPLIDAAVRKFEKKLFLSQFKDSHWADKPVLRDVFWFLVLPHRIGNHLYKDSLSS